MIRILLLCILCLLCLLFSGCHESEYSNLGTHDRTIEPTAQGKESE